MTFSVHTMGVLRACIDAGDGKASTVIKEWCRPRFARGFFATKGKSEHSGEWADIWPGAKPNEKRVQGFAEKVIGANRAKLAVYERLALPPGEPGGIVFGKSWTPEMFMQLTAEELSEYQRGSFTFRRFTLKKGRANEILDATALALAAYHAWLADNQSLEKSRRYIDEFKKGNPNVQT